MDSNCKAYNRIASFFNSKPIRLEAKDNVIPGLNNETISMQAESIYGYRIISKATQFNSLNKDYRTFTISFAKHLRAEDMSLPFKAIFFATSFRSSFDIDSYPHITEIRMNHHTKVSYKVKLSQRSKEKHPDCEEKTSKEVYIRF